jgi:hypothetical protein
MSVAGFVDSCAGEGDRERVNWEGDRERVNWEGCEERKERNYSKG